MVAAGGLEQGLNTAVNAAGRPGEAQEIRGWIGLAMLGGSSHLVSGL